MERRREEQPSTRRVRGEASPTPRSLPESRIRLVALSERADTFAGSDELAIGAVSDEGLIAALVAGETLALGVLYDRHARVIFSLLVRIVGDRGGAEDLLQEVFLRAWQQANSFDEGRGTVRCWMLGIAHHLALNELRRRRRRPQLVEHASNGHHDGENVYAAYVDPAPDPALDACSAVRNAGIAGALEQLPAAQRIVLTMYAAGFSQTEIAANLGEPLGTVKSRMRRALCHLRETLPRVGIDAGWPVD